MADEKEQLSLLVSGSNISGKETNQTACLLLLPVLAACSPHLQVAPCPRAWVLRLQPVTQTCQRQRMLSQLHSRRLRISSSCLEFQDLCDVWPARLIKAGQ